MIYSATRDSEGNIISETYAPLHSPQFTGTPQAPTAAPNDDSKQLATTAFVAEAIRRLVGAAPETLDTLTELAVAINKDADFAATVADAISKKQDKHDALTSIAKLATDADKMIYTTASDVYAVTALTDFARKLLADENAAAARNTLDALGKTENAVSATTAQNCTGNASTADKLKTARQINIFDGENEGAAVDFDGSENLTINLPKIINAEIIGNAATTDKLKTARQINISDGENESAAVDFDGSENLTINLPKTINAEIIGNATSADKLKTARQINISDGENESAAVDFDGSENLTINLPKTINAEIIGNASTADKFKTARQINISDGENESAAVDFDGSENLTINLPKTINAEIIGNAATSNKLKTARQINISDGENASAAVDFDGSENITINLPKIINAEIIGNSASADKLKTARQINISDGENASAAVDFDGSENITINLPKIINAEIIGNAATSNKLKTARQINISDGENASAAVDFDGSENLTINLPKIINAEIIGNAASATRDGAGNIISETYSPKLEKFPFVIPSEGWIKDASDSAYGYTLDLPIDGLTADDALNINLAPDNHGLSVACGLCATVEISNGNVKFRAKEIPSADIAAEYYILKGTGGKSSSFGAINTSTSQREIIYATPEQNGTLTYTGGELRPLWLNYDPTKLLIAGELTGIDAKSYAVTFTPIGNCTWSDDSRKPRRVIWKISKALVQVPEQISEIIFSGNPQSPELKNFDSAKITLTGDFQNKIDAGIYTARAVPKDNFMFADNSTEKFFTWEIQPLKIDKPALSDTDKIYSALAQSPAVSNFNQNYIAQTGTLEEIDAGDYDAVFELKDAQNTRWIDGTAENVILHWKIGKAENFISLDQNSISLGNANMTAAVNVNRLGDGVISAVSADTDIAAVEVADAQILVTARSSGSTKILVEVAEGSNHFAASATLTVDSFVIKPLNLCTPAEILAAVQSGKAADAWLAGDKTAPIVLNGQIGADLALNNFTVCARILGFDHNKDLESDGNAAVHFALDASPDGNDIAFCGGNYDSASASGVNYFQHNLRTGTNAGGWEASNLRDILGDFFNALPAEWQDIISECNKFTFNADSVTATRDKLFLLAEFEVFGRHDYADIAEQYFQAQYDFFKNGNATARNFHGDSSAPRSWWLRTPQSSNDTSFCRVDVSGVENTYNALYSLGIVPCFIVRS